MGISAIPISSSGNLANVSQDITPDQDNTIDIGSEDKRFKKLYAVMAILTALTVSSLTIGGVAFYTSGDNQTVYINGSLNVNGSITWANGWTLESPTNYINISILNVTDINRTGLVLEFTANQSETDYNLSTIFDSSNNNNDGFFIDGAHGNETGKIEDGIYFDGVNDDVIISYDQSLNLTNELSVCAWVNVHDVNDYQYIIHNSKSDGDDRGWALQITNTDTYRFWGSTDGTWQDKTVTSSQSVQYGEWQHVVGVYGGSNLKIYVNGIETVGDSIASLNDHNRDFKLGEYFDSGFNLNGSIDQLMIFNRSLSADEILNLYHVQNQSGSYSSTQRLYSDSFTIKKDNITKLSIDHNGSIFINTSQVNENLILVSPNNTQWSCSVNNTGSFNCE